MSQEIGFQVLALKYIYIEKEHMDWTDQVMFIFMEIYNII